MRCNLASQVIPLPALREALLNVVVHRDYRDGSDIQIKIFDDQTSVFSPGKFYGGLAVADIQASNYRSRLRNKLVAEAFYLTGNIEKYGSGFIRIRKALRDYPELSLSTQEISGGIMLTFAQINIEQPESRPEKIDSAGQVTGQVTAEIVRLLNIVHGEMSRQQLQDALALKSRDNFDKRYLKPALVLGLIEPTMPDKPNSRHQKYRRAKATAQAERSRQMSFVMLAIKIYQRGLASEPALSFGALTFADVI
jgi:ATP-dependent DNA helicase RecG